MFALKVAIFSDSFSDVGLLAPLRIVRPPSFARSVFRFAPRTPEIGATRNTQPSAQVPFGPGS
jgi:hypothetical protein